jgi:5-methylcytosine-specific restriction protein B
MDSVTPEKIRPLSLADLGLDSGPPEPANPELHLGNEKEDKPEEEIEGLPETDALLQEVFAALAMGFAGVILSGPPGTGKSWYAKRLAHTIADDRGAMRIVQFHTSYQYEDFMLGFAPSNDGNFHLQKKTFALLCDDAAKRPNVQHVLLIDEISRCDVARVFGEALTYIEMDKRGQEFTLASGGTMSVPPNLIILATMNPWDKGVDELDVALERRFAQIDVPPSSDVLRGILSWKGADTNVIDRVVGFFEAVQKLDNEMVHLGHGYFINCIDQVCAHRAWKFLLLPFFKKACRLDQTMLGNITQLWLEAFPPLAVAAPEDATPPEPDQEVADEAVQPAEPT